MPSFRSKWSKINVQSKWIFYEGEPPPNVAMLTARFCDKAFLFTKFTLSSRNKNNNAIKCRRLLQ